MSYCIHVDYCGI